MAVIKCISSEKELWMVDAEGTSRWIGQSPDEEARTDSQISNTTHPVRTVENRNRTLLYTCKPWALLVDAVRMIDWSIMMRLVLCVYPVVPSDDLCHLVQVKGFMNDRKR